MFQVTTLDLSAFDGFLRLRLPYVLYMCICIIHLYVCFVG